LFRFHNNVFDEMPCNWIPLNTHIRFEQKPNPALSFSLDQSVIGSDDTLVKWQV